MNFSVLLSVYFKEKSEFLDQALQSILIKQSVIPNEVILVKDGPLTVELEEIIEKYKINFPEIIKIIPLEKNVGLGKALEIGLKACSNELVARADTDDINYPKRFEKQLKEFLNDPELDAVGSYISEFYNSKDEIIFIKQVPLSNSEIIRKSKRRNPMNHMTVMFKKKSVIDVGSYKHLFYLEDYYLWVRLLSNGAILKNVGEPLVYVRTGEDLYSRRSNPKYITSWFNLQKFMYSRRMIGKTDYFINMVNIISFILIPPRLKKYIYKFYLRKATS
ncbi:glycosyltransferase [Neobacillus drentensis]|uniref:glycosyltransferase n=1 Tax=Neobacillus drentensis TaxID=220684 RepID=UPI003000AC12